jgi:hypothetical protein
MLPMVDPLSVVSTMSLISSAISSVKNAKDLAKQSSDTDLKDRISDVYDAILGMKERVLELDQQNRDLREQLTQKASVARNPEFGYYFVDGDPDPHCQKCYEGSGKLIHFPSSRPFSEGIRRDCIVCDFTSWEKRPVAQPSRRTLSRGVSGWG